MTGLRMRETVAYDTQRQASPWFQVVDRSGRVLYASAEKSKAVAWIARRTDR